MLVAASYRALVSHHKDLETAIDSTHLERRTADRRTIELSADNDAGEIDLAIRGIDGKGSRVLTRGQNLDDGVGIGHILANDGKASVAAAIGCEDEPAIGVVTDGVS